MTHHTPTLHAKGNRGFTLFIALIVSGMLLAIGFSIGNIILKQLQLATSGSDSQIAFYAADSASGCALYWDRKDQNGASVFDTEFGTTTDVSAMTPMSCGSGVVQGSTTTTAYIASKVLGGGNALATTTFYVNYSDLDNSAYRACAKVTVFRDDSASSPHTTIDARGYNAPYDFTRNVCDISNPRTVERGLYLQY